MANNKEEKVNVTGLDQAEDRKEAEYDLVTSLLAAAEFKTSDDNITEAEIKRNGKFLFAVKLHPISDKDTRFARKKASTYMPNPNNKKLPKIVKEQDEVLFKSWIIYLATTEEDQQKIWGNSAVMQKYGLALPVESIDILLTAGEKDKVFDLVGKISGLLEDDDDVADNDSDDETSETMDAEDYAKN